jgi:predicted nucleic acid-binding Zn ribbon protein
MKIVIDRLRVGAFALIVLGVLLAIFGAVRTGALLIALGTEFVAITKYLRSNRHRKIELILPGAMALLLFVVALTLPHAK